MAKVDRDVLPGTVKPINYGISLFELELGGDFSYQGVVKIEVDVLKETKEIVLNSHQLKIYSAEIKGDSASAISYDEIAQRATLSFDKQLEKSQNAVLEVKFSGTMNNTMSGFYRSKYKPASTPLNSVPREGEFCLQFSTQMESCDCRRAIPCFDEPNLKATFDFEIEIPEDQVALSNMPEKSSRTGKNGRKIVAFERTPVMSTYLLAWAFGDFEYVEDFTKRKYSGKHLPVRVYTTRGLKEQGLFGLEHAHQIVDYFSEIFQTDYPLPKIDLLAVHEFSHGAMENWGLITYRTTAILFDEKQSDSKYRNRVAYVVAHELAHMWFGNYVTMDWWSELWLNEGFATYIGWKAIDKLHPEWNIWAQFVTEAVQSAFTLDALQSSHPIEVPVKDALEIDQIFDAISYLKGSSVIRMLSSHLGEEVFLQGVADYLKAHAYGNATTSDLWSALSKASGKDVNTFMDTWIRKIGFPVVTVAEEPGQIGVRQSRFLSTGDVKPEDDQTVWWIPLGLKTDSEAKETISQSLITKEQTVRFGNDSFYKINTNMTGFYRTNYPPERLIKLGMARDQLSIEDQIGLVGDAAALAISGQSLTASLLALCENFQNETNYLVWSQVLASLNKVREVFSANDVISGGLNKYVLKLVTPAAEKFGWEFAPHEDLLTGQLRALLIRSAGGAGHQGIISESKSRFKAFKSGDRDAIHPNLRMAVFRIAIANGGLHEYEAVKQEYLSTNSVDGKEICLSSMGSVPSAELAIDFLDFQFSDKVAAQDNHTGSVALAMNSKVRDVLWSYIKDHWDAVHAKLSPNSVVLDRYLKTSLSRFSSHVMEADIAKFFEDKDTKGYDRGLVQISDFVRGNADYKERDEKLIAEWLRAHGYA